MLELRPWAASIALIVLAVWLGGAVIQRLDCRRAELGQSFATGLVVLGAWLQLLDLIGIPWSPVTVLLPAILAFVLERRGKRGVAGRQQPSVRRTIEPWSWGEWIAAASLGLFAWSAFTSRSMAPDFVYHWGVKGRRFFEMGGIDWAFLERTGAGYLHPDYPLLVSSLYGATATVAGAWSEPSLMLLSVAAAALLILEARAILRDVSLEGWLFDVGVAIVGLVLMAFSMVHEQAGAADLLFALGVTGLSRQIFLLASQDSTTTEAADLNRQLLPVGIWTAFAVATKIEGAPLAAFALAVVTGVVLRKLGLTARGSAGRWRLVLATFWRLWVPAGAVGAWWLFNLYRHDLFQSSNFGAPTMDRVRKTFDALPQALNVASWNGFAWLVLLVPVLVFMRPPSAYRKFRFLIVLPALQLAFYLFTYFGGEQDTTFWVLSSFPRLVFHLMPVVLVSVVLSLSSQRSL